MAENQKIQQIDCTKVPEPTLRRLRTEHCLSNNHKTDQTIEQP